MRTPVLLFAILISAIVHMALLVVVATPYQRNTTSVELPSIELVPQNEAPSFNDEPPVADQQQTQQDKPRAAEAQPDFSQLRIDPVPRDQPQQQQAQRQQQAQPQQQRPAPQQQAQQQAAAAQPAAPQKAEQPQAEPPMPEQPKIAPEMAVENVVDQGNRLAALMNLPPVTGGPNEYGTEADTKAKLEGVEIAQFKAHLKSCWKLPAGVPANAQVKVIIRVALRPNGTLADQPSLIEAAASELGLPIYKSGVAALKQCAPYTMFPAAKYKEWRVLDVNFSPDQMGG